MIRSLATLCVVLFLHITAFPQATSPSITFDYRNPLEYEIAEIEIKGLRYIDKNILLNMTNLKLGQRIMIPGDDISNIIKKMWGLGIFSDVKFEAKKIDGVKIYLVLHVLEKEKLNKIKFQGIDEDDAEDILDGLKITYGSQISKDILNNIEYQTRKFLDEEGYVNADIQIFQKPAEQEGRVDVTVKVDTKGEVEIYDIVSEGNTVLSDKDIRLAMEENKRVFKWTRLNFANIFSSSNLKPDELKKDINLVKQAYRELGYRNVEIKLDTIRYEDVDEDDTYAHLKLIINEGQQFKVRKIDWIGNTQYDTQLLMSELKVKPGDIYNQKKINDRLSVDEDAISNMYLNNGFLFFNVTPVEVRIEGDSVDLEMRVREGKPTKVNKIIIKGNDKTYENVIRRELFTYPGELFSKEDIVRSIRQLSQLSYFDQEKLSTGVRPIPNPETGTVDIEYDLSEVSNDQLELSAGYGGQSFVGSIGLKFGNFSATNFFDPDQWPKFSGDGQSLAFRVQIFGSFSQQYSFSFSEPWLGGANANMFNFSLAYTRFTDSRSINPIGSFGRGFNQFGRGGFGGGFNTQNLTDEQIDALPRMQTYTASVGLGKRLKWPDDYFQVNNSLNYRLYQLKDWSSYLFKNGLSHSVNYNLTFARNSLNHPIFPSSGSRFTLSASITPPFSLFKDQDFWKIEASKRTEIENSILQNPQFRLETSAQKQRRIDLDIADHEASKKYQLLEYYKIKLDFDWYTRIVDKLVIRTTSRFGYLGNYNSEIVSPFEGFFVGGDGFTSNSFYGRENIGVRGYENGVLVPEGTDAATSFVKHSLELRYPVVTQPAATIYLLSFLEGANSWTDHKKINPFDLKRSAGVGVRIFMPVFGMLGFDLGYGFDSHRTRTTTSGQWVPQFIIGQTF